MASGLTAAVAAVAAGERVDTITDALLGEARDGTIPCYVCRGRGQQLLRPKEPCPACFGSGRVPDDARKPPGTLECPDCGGESKRIKGTEYRCLACGVKHDEEGFVQR